MLLLAWLDKSGYLVPLCCCFFLLISNSGSKPLEPDALPACCNSDVTNYSKTLFLKCSTLLSGGNPCLYRVFVMLQHEFQKEKHYRWRRNNWLAPRWQACISPFWLPSALKPATLGNNISVHSGESTIFLGSHLLLRQYRTEK